MNVQIILKYNTENQIYLMIGIMKIIKKDICVIIVQLKLLYY